MSEEITNQAPETEMDDGHGAGGQQLAQPTATSEEKDWKTEADKWKALSRKNEDRLKAALSELEELKKAAMSDAERALEEAKATVRNATAAEFKARIAKAELKSAAASAGVSLPDGIEKYMRLDGLVDDEGNPVEEAIKEIVSSFKPAESSKGFAQGIGIGPQGSSPAPVDYDPRAIADRVRKISPY